MAALEKKPKEKKAKRKQKKEVVTLDNLLANSC